jgi:hypothetical protein
MQTVLRTLARRVGDLAAEVHEAQRIAVAMQTNPERYVYRSDQAPDTYERFLFRTSGPLVHEPSAANRSGK